MAYLIEFFFKDINMKNKIRSKKFLSLIFFLFSLVIFDMFFFVLSKNNYYFIHFLKHDYTYILLFLHFLILFLLAVFIGVRIIWIVLGGIVAIPSLIIYMFIGLAFTIDTDFKTIPSPENSEAVIIEHWVATHGETTYLYKVYQKLSFPGLVKKLTSETFDITVRNQEGRPDPSEIFGLNNAQWLDEKTVVFKTRDGEIMLKLE
ncbi:hypothetical protein [Bacillus sp. 2205SS5-2]|uniref:hypothetical protein n=1 Tax=Bacillus sp. 2205SS5-2 TaxID=3109031 RepID=UPI0030068F28